jgi:hypothetical protein
MKKSILLLFVGLTCIGWQSSGGWSPGVLSAVPMSYLTERATTSDTLSAAEAGKTLSVDCTSSCTFVLPTAMQGLSYSFVSETNEVFYVDTGVTTDTIRYLTMSAGDKIGNPGTTADSIEFISTQSGYWSIKEMKGTWTDSN